MRGPRSVVETPMGLPSRRRKFAIERLARLISGFCPVMAETSSAALSRALASVSASPMPMLTTTFVSFGICMTLA